MKWKLFALFAALVALGQPSVQASPIHYQGSLAVGGPAVGGSVGGFSWISDDAPNVDFWTFSGVAGQSILIRGTRLDSRLDPSFSLYFGQTTADESLFAHDASFGGITFINEGDDEVEVPGPFGDPALVIELSRTGIYTIALGGFASDADPAGGMPYRLAITVPEPTTLPLLAIAALGLGLVLRRNGRA